MSHPERTNFGKALTRDAESYYGRVRRYTMCSSLTERGLKTIGG